MAFVQEKRLCTVESPLGKDFFALKRLEGEEAMSRPFHFVLDLVAKDEKVDFAKVVGKSITLSIDRADGEKRFINGIVSQFSQAGTGEDITTYRAEIVPWFWLLKKRTDCRIFQQKSVTEIIQEVIDALGFANYEIRTTGKYEAWDFCVQYRESDFDFLSRLMEQSGIHYFFEHEEKLHRLVIADSPKKNVDCPGQAKVTYDASSGSVTEEDCVSGWVREQNLQPSKFALADFTYLDPGTHLLVDAASKLKAGADDKFEIYDYPGDYVKMGPDEGSRLKRGEDHVKLRAETSDVGGAVISGSGSCRSFTAGFRFELVGHDRAEFDQIYLLTRVKHLLEQEDVAASGSETTSKYSNEFGCIPHTVPFRPARITPKPLIHGPQTAFVVGKSGEEIFTDKHGRVKVQFHWDRMSEANDTSSCWIRVGQIWAGKNWGGQFVPRIGNEVIVEFIEGDPDRPLITGSVYNAVSAPPYDSSQVPTQTGIKTISSKGGDGFNEIRFDDKKDEEEIFIHGQKNLDFAVENDRREFVGNDRHLTVKKDKYEHVENNRNEKVVADDVLEVGKDRHLKVVGKEAKEVSDSMSLTVGGEVIQVFSADAGIEAGGDLGLAATNIVISGTSSITLEVGGSSIVVDASGVTLKGTNVILDGSMTKLNSGSGSSPKSYSIGSSVAPLEPEKPAEVGTSESGSMAEVKPHKAPAGGSGGSSGKSSAAAKKQSESEKKQEEKHWIEIELLGEDDKPVAGEKYEIELPDGSVAKGTLDPKGYARVEGIKKKGTCKVSFPNLDKEAWEKK